MVVRVSSPGKLFLAGEYAVVEAGYPAVIAAVSQRLYVRIERADRGSLHSQQQADFYLQWSREQGQLVTDQPHSYKLLLAAMQVAEDFLRAGGQTDLAYYRLDIQSELDDAASGTKYGLGSSGAVTVAVIKAVLTFFDYPYTSLLLYKLAVLAQLSCQMTGSFGDLAASSFESLIAYYSVDRTWLLETMAIYGLLDILAMDWVGLQITPLSMPADMELLVGWTGSAASTDRLVTSVQGKVQEEEKEVVFQRFLMDSQACLEGLIKAFENQDSQGVRQGIRQNRLLLQGFSQSMGLSIETPLLARLCDLAEEQGAVAKTSGAGGGDCGICLVENLGQKEAILAAWQTEGIQPLDLCISDEKQGEKDVLYGKM